MHECYFSCQMEILQLEVKEATFLPTVYWNFFCCSLSVNQIVVVIMQMSFSHFRRESCCFILCSKPEDKKLITKLSIWYKVYVLFVSENVWFLILVYSSGISIDWSFLNVHILILYLKRKAIFKHQDLEFVYCIEEHLCVIMLSLSWGIFYEGCEKIYVLNEKHFFFLYKWWVMLMRPEKFIHVCAQVEYEQCFCSFSVWETLSVLK